MIEAKSKTKTMESNQFSSWQMWMTGNERGENNVSYVASQPADGCGLKAYQWKNFQIFSTKK